LCIWLIVLLICPAISRAQNSNFSLYFYNSQKSSKSEQSTNYTLTPFSNWQMLVIGKNLEDNRLDFKQTSRNSNLRLTLLNNSSFLNHSFQSGYEYLYDHSTLESELKPYRNKTGFLGYGMQINPIDSLNFSADCVAYYRQEQDRYISTHKFISQGLLGKINTRFVLGDQSKNILISGDWENKHLDWESYQQASAYLTAGLAGSSFTANWYANASVRNEDLYLLENPDSLHYNSYYDNYDRQFKRNLDTNINISMPLGENLDCQLSEQYSLHYYKHKINRTRNTGDYNNLAQFKLVYQLTDNIELQSNNSHNYYIKDLSYVKNSRIIDARYTNNSLIWEYNPYDSLTVDYTVELRRTEYPDSGHRLDNDYLNKIWKLGWTVFWKDKIRISNRVLYSTRDEIFIDAWLSATNNKVTSLQWQPGCDILVGDSFILQQEYQIRADYDNFYYNTFPDSDIKDTFYRQLLASYHLVYDSTPLVAKMTLPKWTLLPFRSRSSEAVRVDFIYSWERNETSAKDGDVYLINGEMERQIISLVLQKQYGIGIYQITPKYSWGTWEEYNLLVSAIWQLNNNSIAEINLNPVGESITALDWRISCSLNLSF
jgi:hypothetical protein